MTVNDQNASKLYEKFGKSIGSLIIFDKKFLQLISIKDERAYLLLGFSKKQTPYGEFLDYRAFCADGRQWYSGFFFVLTPNGKICWLWASVYDIHVVNSLE
jgi:hypothetical protein